MAWTRTKPDDSSKVKVADDEFRANWAALADALNREHVFDGDGSSDEGKHRPGKVGVVFIGTSAECQALSAGAGIEASGALCFDTTIDSFKRWSGSAWVAYDHMKAGSAGDILQVAWTVPGSFIDGRDPSKDGAKIETCSLSADYVYTEDGTMEHGASVAVPTGFIKSQCHIFMHNCGVWDYGEPVKRIACSAEAPSWNPDAGWIARSTVRHGNGTGTDSHPLAFYVLVCSKRTP